MFTIFISIFAGSMIVSAKQAIIHTENLNVRNGPGTAYDKIKQANPDEVYPIIQINNEWAEIQLYDDTGWVKTDFITIKEKEFDQTKGKNTKKQIVISQANTHLREGPSNESKIIHFVKKGTVLDILAIKGNWYKISYKNRTGYIFREFAEREMDNSSKGLNNKTIIIDAGHGGQDVGAVGASDTLEKEMTYKTAQELENELNMLGAEVIVTRKKDNYISLASRTSLSNLKNIDAFISIHYNSVPNIPDANGIGTYYYHEQQKKLADSIQLELIKETEAKDRGSSYGDYQVLRQNLKPAILVELGFISNKEKEQLLLTDGYQQKIVSGMVNGLQKYFSH